MQKNLVIMLVIGISVFSLIGCGVSDAGKTMENTEKVESETGTETQKTIMSKPETQYQSEDHASVIDIKDATYYDLMTANTGDLYALAYDAEITNLNESTIIWKCSDRREKWEEAVRLQNDTLTDSYIMAGVLREEENGPEAFVVVSKLQETESDIGECRLLHVTKESSEVLNTGDLFEQLESGVWNVRVVNDHVLSIAGATQCVFYDTGQQKAVKSLSYDYCSVGFLPMKEQFIIYDNEIKYCLNAENLEEQEPEEGLKRFMTEMWKENGSDVFPPMKACGDSVICVTGKAIYEYQDGETVQVLTVPKSVRRGKFFNGMSPVCRDKNGIYYVNTLSSGETTLWRIEP